MPINIQSHVHDVASYIFAVCECLPVGESTAQARPVKPQGALSLRLAVVGSPAVIAQASIRVVRLKTQTEQYCKNERPEETGITAIMMLVYWSSQCV